MSKTEPVTIRGGRFVFDTANEELLFQLLPPLVHVTLNETTSARVHALLSMNEEENDAPGRGSAFVVARLMELLLMELLRGEALEADQQRQGCLKVLPMR